MKTIKKNTGMLVAELKVKRELAQENVAEAVASIIAAVREGGDDALISLTEKYDGAPPDSGLLVTTSEIAAAYDAVSKEWLEAIVRAAENIRIYHEKQRQHSLLEPAPDGTMLGHMLVPLERVGIYVPGGTAAYPSSVLMNALPAVVAGVREIVMVSPPGRDGKLRPEVLVAADICGIDEIYKVGGAQAIAALAYGTGSVYEVDKITGPGNVYVTEAKKQVYGQVDIDMLAGPSEILIIADESADPEYLAADLLSQAEHDTLAQAIAISTSRSLLEKTAQAVERRLAKLPRQKIAAASWENRGELVLAENLSDALDFSNLLAPEHLELMVSEPFAWLGKVRHAGAVFLGANTPEPVGDYYAGPNHILPTGGTARFYSVLNVDSFMRKISVLHYSREALVEASGDITLLARAEGLEAHAQAVLARVGSDK
jgi:histidinol dehydrogenase